MNEILSRNEYVSAIELDDGHSQNVKYKLVDKYGKSFVLRVSDIKHYDEKLLEFNILQTVFGKGVTTPEPVEFGVCNDGKSVYMIVGWIEGKCVMKTLFGENSPQKRYNIGFESGKTLRKLHNIKTNYECENWLISYGKVVDNFIEIYRNCAEIIPQLETAIDYINENRCILRDRPCVIRHGDFHWNNIIVMPDNEIGLIDFECIPYGDGWQELAGLVWAVWFCDEFPCGQIDGYFDGNVPELFFRIFAIYVSVYALEHVERVVLGKNPDETREEMCKNVVQMLDMYGDFSSIIPKWYTNKYKTNK